jgi:chaperonin GroEL (HSP60 family)
MATTGGGCVEGSVTRAVEDAVMTKKIIFDTQMIRNKRSNAFKI